MLKDKKQKAKVSGRKISSWKIVLVSLILLIVTCMASVYIFLETYVPDVDKDPHFLNSANTDIFVKHDKSKVRKYHAVREIMAFGEAVRNVSAGEFVRVDGVYNFLILGHDKVALNTDVIMVLSFDTNDGSISIMQLPRDTYIRYGGYSHKINSMFAYLVADARANGSKNVYHDALEDYCEILENSLSIELDNYALINLDAFSNIVDIIGGVPITVAEDMHYDDPAQGLSIHINKGYQVLDGKTAAGFVRFRSGYINADLGRQNAQKMFMTAFFKKMQNSFSVTNVTKIVEQAFKNVTTDMSITDAVYYAKEALSADLANLNMMTLPGEGIYSDGVAYYVLYKGSVHDIVNEYFNVYNIDIPENMFDQEKVFTDAKPGYINTIYNRDNTEYVVNNGQDVNEQGIYIPRVYDVPSTEEPDTSSEIKSESDEQSESMDTEADAGDESTDDSAYEDEPFEDIDTEADTEADESDTDTEIQDITDEFESEENTEDIIQE